MPKREEIIEIDDIVTDNSDDAVDSDQPEDDGELDVIVTDEYGEGEPEDPEDDAEDDGASEEEENRPRRAEDPSITEAKTLYFQTKLAQRELANERAQDRILALRGRHNELIETGKRYKLLEAQAINEANGNDALQYSGLAEGVIVEANEIANIHDQLLRRVEEDAAEINQIKETATQSTQPKERRRMIDADALEATILSNTTSFMAKIGYESLSQKLKNAVDSLDRKLFESGYNPASQKYWQLLEKRFNQKYHNRGSNSNSNQSQNNQESEAYMPRESPPVGGKTSSSGSSRKEVYLSRERRDALIAAGVWDDPVLRTKYVKQYQKWDKENAQR